MDRDRFDAITRLLGAEGSRRTALGAALGAFALGRVQGAGAKKKNRKKKKKNPPRPCFGTKDCNVPFPSDGQDFEDCNLAGAFLLECEGCNFRGADLGGADLSIVRFQGSSFREANLRGANFEDADVSGASFRDACLVDATFLGANTDGAHFGDAILCNTVLSNGDVDNSGCGRGTDCCPTVTTDCVKDADCPGQETCVDGICVIPNPTCEADPNACEGTFTPCGGTGGAGTCFCYVTIEGDSRCLNLNNDNTPNCLALPQCTSSDECDPGEFCADLVFAGVCCPGRICGRECPEFGAESRRNGREVTPPRP